MDGRDELVVQPNSIDGLKEAEQPATGMFNTFQISSVELLDHYPIAESR